MKKIIIYVILILLGIGAYFGYKWANKNYFYDYQNEIANILDNYYATENNSYLKELKEVLNTYKDNNEMISNIKSQTFKELSSWVTQIDSKYICNMNNKNSCIISKTEITNLEKKIDNIYIQKNINGENPLSENSYNTLKTATNEMLRKRENILNNTATKNPKTVNEIMKYKCSVATDCQSCYSGKCTCLYTENGVTEKISCDKQK